MRNEEQSRGWEAIVGGTVPATSQCDLDGFTWRPLRNPFQQPAGHASCFQREPRDERDPIAPPNSHNIVPFAIAKRSDLFWTDTIGMIFRSRHVLHHGHDSPTNRIFPSDRMFARFN